MNKATLSLTPKLHPYVKDFLEKKEKLKELASGLGDPLAIVFPEIISENLFSFQNIFTTEKVKGKVYYAHKTNKSSAFLKQVAKEKGFVDVASLNELKHALACGVKGTHIEATGPKTSEFILLALQHEVIVNVDSLPELESVATLATQLGIKANVLIRLTGFSSEHTHIIDKDSRFGISVDEKDKIFAFLNENEDRLHLLGFSFHLDSTSLNEKIIAIEQTIMLVEEALDTGFMPSVINIGGGYKANYLENEDEWSNYNTALKEAILGQGEEITWHNTGFGMHVENGKLRGGMNTYAYYDSLAGPEFLREILQTESKTFGGREIGKLLSEMMLEVWIEPGRALVDQAGITIGRTIFIKSSAKKEILVGVNMKRSDVSFLDQEYFVDPLVISSRSPVESEKGVYFVGNMCLESDLLYRHKTFLSQIPQEDDLLVFVNTAGYSMDFNSTESIMQPITKKIAVWGESFSWSKDEVYNPFKKEERNDL